MEDDRRPSGAGDPSSPPPPDQHDAPAKNPEPGTAPHVGTPRVPAPGGPPPHSPAFEPQRPGSGEGGA
ncbi:sigma-70 family RNA polymerase sigma factor, partial [Streptomonospora algeriensis]